jgi:hypothetical protein
MNSPYTFECEHVECWTRCEALRYGFAEVFGGTMSQVTVWVAYNSDNECFASHEGAQEAMDGLGEAFSYAQGSRVVELRLTLPSAKPVAVAADVPDGKSVVNVSVS